MASERLSFLRLAPRPSVGTLLASTCTAAAGGGGGLFQAGAWLPLCNPHLTAHALLMRGGRGGIRPWKESRWSVGRTCMHASNACTHSVAHTAQHARPGSHLSHAHSHALPWPYSKHSAARNGEHGVRQASLPPAVPQPPRLTRKVRAELGGGELAVGVHAQQRRGGLVRGRGCPGGLATLPIPTLVILFPGFC